jgi:hypothetical protein
MNLDRPDSRQHVRNCGERPRDVDRLSDFSWSDIATVVDEAGAVLRCSIWEGEEFPVVMEVQLMDGRDVFMRFNENQFQELFYYITRKCSWSPL